MQVDNVCFHIDLYAFHSFSALPKILYDDSCWIIGRIRRRTALVRKVYLSNCGSRSLLNCLRYIRKCSCHKILWLLLHILSTGSGVGKSYIFSRWVNIVTNTCIAYWRTRWSTLYLRDLGQYLHMNYTCFRLRRYFAYKYLF